MSVLEPAVQRPPAWRTCLDIEGQSADHYRDYVNAPLFAAIDGTPRRVLELGCATGMFGQHLKARFAGATVVGVEANRCAIEQAQARLDQVVATRLEDMDLAAAGCRHGEFDTVIAADILEHLVYSWQLLERIRPFLAPRAQIAASIPNARNLEVIGDLLMRGRFEYRERGPLDVTHVRFFALDDVRLLFEQTGYQVEGYSATIAPNLATLYRDNRGRDSATIAWDRLTFSGVSPQELLELCAEQWLIRARVP